ncbi:MAG: LysM peptidoglycan-binding domain-containing protein [candidate division KSB1 bacterium]|nr:LysM peptidoglycan-binding domain-containing protein [candidate division KSB1 bacterium]
MVQRVPAHLGENENFSPWLVVGAVAVIVLVGGLLLFFSGLANPTDMAAPVATRTRAPRATTVIIVTATPPAKTATPTPRPTPYMVEYIVKSGDTLIGIANRFNVTVDQIREANDLASDLIYPGDKLLIPQPTPTPKSQAENSSPTSPPTATLIAFALNTPTLLPTASNQTALHEATPTSTPGVVLYYVQPGDTLGMIAKAFSTTVESIMNLNQMKNTNIRAGQALTVPIGAWTPTATATLYIEPTATLTPRYTYSPPLLLSPPDGAEISGNVPLDLQWTGVGVLAPDEYYVVSLRYGDGAIKAYNAGQRTSYRIEELPVTSDGAIQFTWYVVVVRGSGCGPSSPAAVQPCAVSPPSETRTFVWK